MSAEVTQLHCNDLVVEVAQKNIKNLHLRVYPPHGQVRVSAPKTMALDTIQVFVTSRLDWIKKQQIKIAAQKPEAPKKFVTRESHCFRGERYQLNVIETSRAARVELNHGMIDLYVRPGSSMEKRGALLDAWYRQQLKQALPPLIEKWEKIMEVKVDEFGIKKMKTRWGTCNPNAKRIWLNLELVKKPDDCLEYVVVHEMVHLLERSHNSRFVALMDQFLPQWKSYKDDLNRQPVKHDDWDL